MSTNSRAAASGAINGLPAEKSYFDQQRELLVGEIAQVDYPSANPLEHTNQCDECRASNMCYKTSTSSTEVSKV